ncbi:hypothetical protein Zmor_005910 [Zophobas morio]|uniref:Uncharacterized protein n=1 Tax=Zophobas morio TaxID=2755281 RepID=A0AA38ITW0_9CUCU|nr:hypothetical protein Zmor_005910 [Zophobas morio]
MKQFLRTYEDATRHYKKFCSLEKNKKIAKECFSTVNNPIFEEGAGTTVLQKCVIPELHILQGFVNHLFWNGLVPLVGREVALSWPQRLGLVTKSYQGEIFEGNACRRLLKEADRILDLDTDRAKLELVPIISALKAMNKVVEDCFSTNQVKSKLTQDIVSLRKALRATGISETLKIHIALNHLEECIAYLGNCGLGLWSEQKPENRSIENF